MSDFPFPSAYWVIPDKLMAGSFPASTDPVIRNIKLNGLIELNIKVVVNLMEEEERNYAGKLFFNYVPVLSKASIHCRRFPIRDMWVPTVSEMKIILDYIDMAHQRGNAVYLHCWGGIGRTGTVVGCYLIRHGLADVSNVFDMIMKLKSESSLAERLSPETDRQREFVMNWSVGL